MPESKERQEFDMFVDDQFYSRVAAFSKEQAINWFSKSHGFENMTVIKDRIEAKPAKPVEIATSCLKCGSIGAESGLCQNCSRSL